MRIRSTRLAWFGLVVALGCGDDSTQTSDSGQTADAGTDGATDAGTDAGPTSVTIDDFEGDTSGWTYGGIASVETDSATSSHALRLNLANATCGSSSAERTVTIPANAASIRFRLSGDIPDANDKQIWFSLREDSVSVYEYATPAIPLSTARDENWCVPANSPGATVTLSFVIRTQSVCEPMDAWIDDIVFSSDATGCTPMLPPI